jgi:hypothetical protein
MRPPACRSAISPSGRTCHRRPCRGSRTERSVVLALREELKKRINASLEADQLDHEAVAALGRLTNHAGVYHGVYKEANHG